MKFYFFIGTTAELIKLSPVIRELEKRKKNFKIITSGQTKIDFGELSFFIKKKSADIALETKSRKSSVFLFVLWFFKSILAIPSLANEFKGFNKENSYFIIHGDPVSSLIGALVAKFYRLKLVHIESGLRSFNFIEPFPEEICRFLISKLADVHFSPNKWSLDNLTKTGGIKINTFENTQIESYFAAIKKGKRKNVLNLKSKKYFVLIFHRQEHVIYSREKSKRLLEFILAKASSKMKCIFIVHATTLNFLESINFKLTDEQKEVVQFVPRLNYVEFVSLVANSQFLITDGGSNQEEAYYMGLPCLVLREATERIEGLKQNVVLSKNNIRTINSFMNSYKKYRRKKVEIRVKPSKIVVDYLCNTH